MDEENDFLNMHSYLEAVVTHEISPMCMCVCLASGVRPYRGYFKAYQCEKKYLIEAIS